MQFSIERVDSASAPVNTSTGSPSPKTAPDETTPAAMPWTWYAPCACVDNPADYETIEMGLYFSGLVCSFSGVFSDLEFHESGCRSCEILPYRASLTTAEGYLAPEKTSPKRLGVERHLA